MSLIRYDLHQRPHKTMSNEETALFKKDWPPMIHRVKMVKMFNTMDLPLEYQKILIDSNFLTAPKIGNEYEIDDIMFENGHSFYALKGFSFPTCIPYFQSKCFESLPNKLGVVVGYHQLSITIHKDGGITHNEPEITPERKNG